jgi:exopolysaccharide biosynthesis protein
VPTGLLAADPDRAVHAQEKAIRYSAESRTTPRPLHIHRLQVDLVDSDYELAVMVGNDPDGAGPAEAALTMPEELARRGQLMAAVNANAWMMIKPRAAYLVGGACDISGWAKTRQGERSDPDAAHWSVWVDSRNRVGMGSIAKRADAVCAVSGFGGLIEDGKILVRPSEVRHPRTALGLDQTRRWLTLLVVDGRRKGYSEGVSLHELATLMQEIGCHQAVNLDGGGSSIMLLADERGKLRTKNRPSGKLGARPIPVMLGLRRRVQQ